MNKDRQQILNFLETGQGKKTVQNRLKDPDFRKLYLSIARDEAALYQVFAEAKILPAKKKRLKKSPIYILSSLAALVAISLILLNTRKTKVAFDVATQTWYEAGSHFQSTKSSTFTLADGSQLTFKGPAQLVFNDTQNITIEKGLVQAIIKPRPKNKLSFITLAETFTVLGTQFKLFVENDSTLLDVSEGKVAVAGKVFQKDQHVLVVKGAGLIQSTKEISKFQSSLMLRELASQPKASFVTDFQIDRDGEFINLVNGQKVQLPDHVKATQKGLLFDEKGAIEVMPAGKPSVNINLSVWLKYNTPLPQKVIASHEYFEDQNIGGWKLCYFEKIMRMHTVIQPHYHARTDFNHIQNKWFHLSINIKSLQQGNIEITAFINGQQVANHNRQMLFLNKQQKLLIGGLTEQAISAFSKRDQRHNYFYKGEMADFIYMNDILTEDTIKKFYEKSRTKFE